MAAAVSSARVAGPDPFVEYNLIEHAIRTLTVKALKALIADVNKGLYMESGYLRLSGNKAELANRVIGVLAEKRAKRDAQGFQSFKQLVINNGGWVPDAAQASNPVRPANSYAGAGGAAGGPSLEKLNGTTSYGGFPPAVAATPPSTVTARSIAGVLAQSRVNFKPSPFWEIKQFVSSMVICQEAPTGNDRKSAAVYVQFTADQVAQLRQLNSPYQARLFCTTHEAYAVGLSGRFQAPVEFPQTCEARVNGAQLSVNLRSSKKNVGRVPPPNLNKDNQLILQPQRQNRIELTYTNCQKKHVIIVAICEVTSAEVLVERLRQKAQRTKEEVLSSMKKTAEDDDIQAGSATMDLKCPLISTRMKTPCRSNQCTHVQCFDALSFYSMNEQSSSWSCPICNQAVKPEDLRMDGYVADIIKRVPEDQDLAIVEPDGSWKTPDGRYMSDGYAAAPTAEASSSTSSAVGTGAANAAGSSRLTASAEPRSENGDAKLGGAARGSHGPHSSDNIVILDSPSPPSTGPAPAAAMVAPTTADSSRQSSSRPAPEPAVIDLTLSDSDEEPTLPPSRPRPPPPPGAVAAPASAPASASARTSAAAQTAMRPPPQQNGPSDPPPPYYLNRLSDGHASGQSTVHPAGGSGGSGGGAAAAARRLSSDGQRTSLAARQDEDDTGSDEDVVRRPGKRARLEASQGGQMTSAPGQPRVNGIGEEGSPTPGSAAAGGGPFAGPASSSTSHLRPGSASGQRHFYPQPSHSSRAEAGVPPRRLYDRGAPAARPSYPISYLDTDIAQHGHDGVSSPPDAVANGTRPRGERYEADWGDEGEESERGYTGVGRDTYFADDDWW